MLRYGKVLVVAPIIGSTGNAVNERQIVITISKYSKHVLVLTPLSISAIVMRLRKYLTYNKLQNITILPIPFTVLYEHLWICGIVLHVLYSFVLFVFVYLLDLVLNFDFIYVRDSRFAIFISFSKRLARKSFVKIATILEDELRVRFLKKLFENVVQSMERHVIKRVAGIVVHSFDFAKHLVLKRRILPRIIIVMPPGITLSLIDIVKRHCLRKRIVENEVIVGFLGQLQWWQGVDILCDIIAELKMRGLRARLKVIGDGPLRRWLVNRCRDLGIEVEITGFLSHHKALCIARKEFDVLILPRVATDTTSSTVPIKVIEALALEIPVVITDLPIYEELKGKGLYTSKRTPKDFADAILKAFTTPSQSLGYEYLRKYFYEHSVANLIKVASEIPSIENQRREKDSS